MKPPNKRPRKGVKSPPKSSPTCDLLKQKVLKRMDKAGITREALFGELQNGHIEQGHTLSMSTLNRVLASGYKGGMHLTTLLALQSWLKQPVKK